MLRTTMMVTDHSLCAILQLGRECRHLASVIEVIIDLPGRTARKVARAGRPVG